MNNKILLIGLAALMLLVLTACGGVTGGATAGGGSTSIPLSDLSETAKFYEYTDGGTTIKYFAVLGSDGEPRTAFDACDVCGGYKGYEQQGSDIKCINCGKVFKIDGLGTKNKGSGCWPSHLPHTVEGDTLFIKTKDIKAGRHRFA
jgi:uncharacterized membrane protein